MGSLLELLVDPIDIGESASNLFRQQYVSLKEIRAFRAHAFK
jgi:hypothetical protein